MGLGALRGHGKDFWFTLSPHHQKGCPGQFESVNQLNESSSFIPGIAMVSRLRGPVIPLFFAGVFLVLFAAFLSIVPGSPPALLEAQTNPQMECPDSEDCEPTVEAASRTPAAITSFEVEFVTPVEIQAFTGSIVMELHEDIGVPRGINPNSVRLLATSNSEGCSPSLRGAAAFAELTDQDDPRHPTIIRIFHNLREGQTPARICEDSKVAVTFQRGAGISNPTEGGAFSWKVGVGNDDNLVDARHPDEKVRAAFLASSGAAEDADVGLLVDREIQLSHEEISRGDSITVIARGFKNGHTLTVWRDANVNGMRETGESELCQVEVAGNDIGYCNFSVHSPPFEKGAGMCPHRTDDMGNVITADLDCNFINAVDGLGGSTIILGKGSDDIYEANQLLELVGRIEADIVQGPGGDIQVQVFDFPEGVITGVTIGGVPADVDQLRIGSSGRLYFSVPVPDNVRLGRQYLRVEVDRVDDMNPDPYSREVIVDISQPKAIVRIFPETVLANQRVSLSGLGFHDERGTTIDEVQFGGFTLKPSRVNGGAGAIDVAGDGNWNGSVDLPIVEATTSEGTHTLRVKDSRGRTGSVEVAVPPREVTVAPIWGRPGTTIKVIGTGFPSRNDHGSSVNLRIYYDAGERYTVNSAEPDANGNFVREVPYPLEDPHSVFQLCPSGI